MNIEKRIFYGIMSDLEDVIYPRVRRSLQMLLKDSRAQGKIIKLGDDFKIIRAHYNQQVNIILDEIEREAFTAGLINFAGFKDEQNDNDEG